jgi:thiol-disulfide isomerase/thioredoxin
VAGLFAVAAALLAVVPFVEGPRAGPPPGVAPDFTIDTTAGSPYSLGTDLGVRPVFVEFMHPDCSHCQAMGPRLQTVHGEFGAQVAFVAVAIRLGGFQDPTVASAAAFASEHGHAWTYGVDRGTAARVAYGVTGTPLFVFIAANGTVASTWPGEMPLGDLRARLAQVAGG